MIKKTSFVTPSPSSLDFQNAAHFPQGNAAVSTEPSARETACQAHRQLQDLLGPGRSPGASLSVASRRFLSRMPAAIFTQATRQTQSNDGILESVAEPLRVDSSR